jgi:hypothetical protein
MAQMKLSYFYKLVSTFKILCNVSLNSNEDETPLYWGDNMTRL